MVGIKNTNHPSIWFKPTRSKLQRLMILSCVSPRRPDLPARFELLNDDILGLIVNFVGNKSYRSFGGINRGCNEVYIKSGMTKETFLCGYGPLAVIKERCQNAKEFIDRKLRKSIGKGVLNYNRRDVLDWALEERNRFALKGIYTIASIEGRIDILVEVFNGVEDWDDKGGIFYVVGLSAAYSGKLNVLKWLCTKGLYIHEEMCAEEAARHGHLHIMKWLREEKGLKLTGYLYSEEINFI